MIAGVIASLCVAALVLMALRAVRALWEDQYRAEAQTSLPHRVGANAHAARDRRRSWATMAGEPSRCTHRRTILRSRSRRPARTGSGHCPRRCPGRPRTCA